MFFWSDTFSCYLIYFVIHFAELKDKLGSEFVYGFMQVMDGEKDPRNLVILFRLYPVIVQNFPVCE